MQSKSSKKGKKETKRGCLCAATLHCAHILLTDSTSLTFFPKTMEKANLCLCSILWFLRRKPQCYRTEWNLDQQFSTNALPQFKKSHTDLANKTTSFIYCFAELWRNQEFEDWVCVSEKCYLLQESEHTTRAMVRLWNVSELGSSGRSGKICMTYQLLCWEHQVRKARWRGKWIWAGKEIKLADLEYTKWIGTKYGN